MKIKELINRCIENNIRKIFLKDIITNIGIIKEQEDKFICYAKQFKIDKIFKKSYCYDIYLSGIREIEEKERELNKKYNLDKPIYYIFENIEFDEKVEIMAVHTNTHVIFRNCKFRKNILIKWANEITFENNKYYDESSIFYKNERNYLKNQTKMLNKLTFINENFINSKEDHHPTRFGIDLNLDTLEIINSNIIVDNTVRYKDEIRVPNREGLNIKANFIKIVNSKIDIAELYLDSKSIVVDNFSKINASNGTIIENENNDLEISNIKTPYLVYNGLELKGSSNEEASKSNIIIRRDRIELQKARAMLLETWKNIANKGTSRIDEVVNKHKENLNNEPLKRVLKKSK